MNYCLKPLPLSHAFKQVKNLINLNENNADITHTFFVMFYFFPRVTSEC